MKKMFFLSALLCYNLLIFSQGYNKKAPEAEKWISGFLSINNGAAQNLPLDTTLLDAGFKSLHAVTVCDNTNNFKFERNDVEIAVINDFTLPYEVKQGFVGRQASFTLYLYSGKMMLYKKNYTVMFDGTRNPKVLVQN